MSLADTTPEVLPDTGLAHRHFRLPGSGMLARVPKQSQMQLHAGDNLAYQVATGFDELAAMLGL